VSATSRNAVSVDSLKRTRQIRGPLNPDVRGWRSLLDRPVTHMECPTSEQNKQTHLRASFCKKLKIHVFRRS